MSQSLDELRQWLLREPDAREVCSVLQRFTHWPVRPSTIAELIVPLTGESGAEIQLRAAAWVDKLVRHGVLVESPLTRMIKLSVDLGELLRVESPASGSSSKGAALGPPHAVGVKTPRVRVRVIPSPYTKFGQEFGLTRRHARVLLELYCFLRQAGEGLIDGLQLKVYRRLQTADDPLALATMASMGVAFVELKRKGYLDHKGYGDWSLTDAGSKVAQQLSQSWDKIAPDKVT